MTPAPFLDLCQEPVQLIALHEIDCAARVGPIFRGCHATHHYVNFEPVPLQVHLSFFSRGGVTVRIGLIGCLGDF